MRKPGWCSGLSYDPVTVVTRVQIPLRALFTTNNTPSTTSVTCSPVAREQPNHGPNVCTATPRTAITPTEI